MQQVESLALLPGPCSQLSPDQDYHSGLTRPGDGTYIDTSYPTSQNATPQCPFTPDSALKTAIETPNDRTPVIDKKSGCTWPNCPQAYKEYTASQLRFVRPTHIRPHSRG
jgi:hypothetical protein